MSLIGEIGSLGRPQTFDDVGNRKTSLVNGVSTAYSYDDNARLLSAGAATYGYDDQGNQLTISEGSNLTKQSYNDLNQLISSQVNSEPEISFSYDANGIRVSRTHNGITTQYLVDHNRDYAQVLAETENGTLSNSYVYGHDLIKQERAGNSSFYLTDGIGSTRLLADDAAQVTDSYDYAAFGELLQQTGATENSYRYTGEQYDAGLDNYYLRARYYDQGVGRFTQMDEWLGKSCTPITLNKYVYAHQEPTNGVDPSGNMFLLDLGAATKIRGILSTTARATVRVFSGARPGRVVKLSKKIGCYLGKQYVDRKSDNVQGHHPLQQSIGGQEEQHLLYTARRTHQMLHTVQNMLFRDQGLPPLNKGKKFYAMYFASTPGARKLAYNTAIVAARRVDKFCGYKGKKSFEKSLRRELKRWVKNGGEFE